MKTLFKFTKIYLGAFALSLLFLTGCKDGNDIDSKVAEIPLEISIERFDQLFYNTPEEQLGDLKKTYPYLFPEQVADTFWIEKKKDTLFQELYEEVEKKYGDLGTLPNELESFFKHVKYYYPNENPKKVITLISEVDVTAKAIYADSLSFISLDTYLGEDHHFYKGFPEYLRGAFNESQILPDLAESFLLTKLKQPKDRSFLSQMIYQGKMLYAKEQLLPNAKEGALISYTSEQIDWCFANESEMWRYFIENKLLFDTDPKLQVRFLQPSPFSKFYLEIDAASPGRTGSWLGWQIVRSYMKNNNVTLQELFNVEAKELFEKSRYKPKK